MFLYDVSVSYNSLEIIVKNIGFFLRMIRLKQMFIHKIDSDYKMKSNHHKLMTDTMELHFSTFDVLAVF